MHMLFGVVGNCTSTKSAKHFVICLLELGGMVTNLAVVPAGARTSLVSKVRLL